MSTVARSKRMAGKVGCPPAGDGGERVKDYPQPELLRRVLPPKFSNQRQTNVAQILNVVNSRGLCGSRIQDSFRPRSGESRSSRRCIAERHRVAYLQSSTGCRYARGASRMQEAPSCRDLPRPMSSTDLQQRAVKWSARVTTAAERKNAEYLVFGDRSGLHDVIQPNGSAVHDRDIYPTRLAVEGPP